ncbi:MAG: hypothetical protein ACLSG9_06435 [Eubacterium sp.]
MWRDLFEEIPKEERIHPAEAFDLSDSSCCKGKWNPEDNSSHSANNVSWSMFDMYLPESDKSRDKADYKINGEDQEFTLASSRRG